jgi:hypothetical protein
MRICGYHGRLYAKYSRQGKLCCAESKTLSQIQDNRAVLAQHSCRWLLSAAMAITRGVGQAPSEARAPPPRPALRRICVLFRTFYHMLTSVQCECKSEDYSRLNDQEGLEVKAETRNPGPDAQVSLTIPRVFARANPWTYAQATVILDEVEGHIPVLPKGTVFKHRRAIEAEESAAQDTAPANTEAGIALRQDPSGTNETGVDSDSEPRQKKPRQVCIRVCRLLAEPYGSNSAI